MSCSPAMRRTSTSLVAQKEENRKWCKGTDYSWHVDHLLREFGFAPLAISSDRQFSGARKFDDDDEAALSFDVTH